MRKSMIIVTGGAGFIGSNLVKGLNGRGITDIVVVDDLTQGEKFVNLSDCRILDYRDKNDFLNDIITGKTVAQNLKAIFHLGACSTTTEWDGKFMMKNNFEYSKILLHHCADNMIPFIYASSASVYGNGPVFREELAYENTLNVYAYSKFLFDQYVRAYLPQIKSQVAGFRYFNVYGPREQHKDSMASVAFHFYNQIQSEGKCGLFEGTDGYANGEQKRDFVYVGDAVNVNLWFYDHPEISGIFNVGTGRAQTFNNVAEAVIGFCKKGRLEYIPFPDHLKGRYQSFTEADISALRAAGYTERFRSVEEGVKAYLEWCIKK